MFIIGLFIAFISDETGEDQVYVIDQKGEKEKVQITNSLRAKLDSLQWACDNKALSFRDSMNRLYVASLEYANPSEAPKLIELIEVARDKYAGFPGASWSPDGAYLAYELSENNGFYSFKTANKSLQGYVDIVVLVIGQ